ncbi:MAG: hypothetical protein JWR71_3383 [Pseudarthrobacter sp.]|nr:hypothetical protein [Pseudarthrobacter sp.]
MSLLCGSVAGTDLLVRATLRPILVLDLIVVLALILTLIVVLVLALVLSLALALIRCGAGRTSAWTRWLRSPGRKR